MRTWFALLVLVLGVVVLSAGPALARVVVAGLMLLAPGWLLWSWLGADVRLPRFGSLGIRIGLSLSVVPLTFLWVNTLGLALPSTALRLVLGVASGVAIWRAAQHPRPPRGVWWLTGGLAAIAVLTFGLRLYQIRDVVLPLWVDSVHHALLIRIVGETGRIPTSLEPYLAVDDLVYHWGYHAIAATWRSLTGLPVPVLMLLSGQLINTLHVLGVYTLGAYLTRSPLSGLFAALVTGLVSLMPAFYVTWGRYTQLTGLLLLSALLVLSCALVERPRLEPKLLVAAALLLAGLILIHYRVLVFFAAFMLPWSLLFGLVQRRRIPAALGRLVLLGGLGMLFAAPWVYEIARLVLLPLAKAPGELAGSDSYNGVDPTLLWTTNSYGIFTAAGCGLLLALIGRRWRVAAAGGWIAAMALIANPNAVGLPSSWFINNHSVLITLFLPLSVLAGWGARQVVAVVVGRTPPRWRRVPQALVAGAVIALALRGCWQFRDVINMNTNLTTAADLPALAWVAEHTPPDARFLINAAPWLNRAYRGTDAGWWIMPLTGRWTSTPPSIYDYGSPEYVAAIAQRSEQVASLRPGDEQKVDRIVGDNAITHVFIGSKGGPLKPDMFWGRPQYEAVYDQDGVTIFAVRHYSTVEDVIITTSAMTNGFTHQRIARR